MNYKAASRSISQPVWRRPEWLIFLILIASSGVFVFSKVMIVRHYRAKDRLARIRIDAGRAVQKKIDSRLEYLRDSGASPDAIRAEFGSWPHYTDAKISEDRRHISFEDPLYKNRFGIDFTMGRIESTAWQAPPWIFFDLRLWKKFSRVTMACVVALILGFGSLLILGLALNGPVPTFRRRVAPIMIGSALLSFTLLAIQEYWLTLFSIHLHQGPPYIAFGMLLTGFLFLFLPICRRPDDPLCRHCGYDLTGNISGPCPECGNPTPPAPLDPVEIERKLAAIKKAKSGRNDPGSA